MLAFALMALSTLSLFSPSLHHFGFFSRALWNVTQFCVCVNEDARKWLFAAFLSCADFGSC